MKRFISAIALWLICTLPVRAHFIWIVPEGADTARVVFSENLEPDDPKFLDKIGHMQLSVRGADGKSTPAKITKGKDAYRLELPGKGTRTVEGVCRYGVIQRGNAEPFLLVYHAAALVSQGTIESPAQKTEARVDEGSDPSSPFRIVLAAQPNKLQVTWHGKPLAGAEAVLLLPDRDSPVMTKTDENGQVSVASGKAGKAGVRVRHVEAKPGELDGKKYTEARHYATLVLEVGAEKKDSPAVDAAATKLLADARAARAQWTEFPGFVADLEVNIDGKLSRGKVSVNAKGKVNIEIADEAAEAWARRQLASVAGHRIDNSSALNTPCAFADSDADHPLGRMIRVLNDEFHSSYRIRDRQIIVVNRRMKDSRFTITVLENRLNEEKQFLPVSFVVNTWDLKTDALKNAESFHHTWTRLGKYDLPVTLLVVTATAGKQEARSLKLSNHKLGP